MRPQADCPKCGALLFSEGCGVCGYGRDEIRDPSTRQRVQPGSSVYITFHELKRTPAIVRSVQDRKEGILSVRMLPKDMPGVHGYVIDPADGMFALVVKGDEWELKP